MVVLGQNAASASLLVTAAVLNIIVSPTSGVAFFQPGVLDQCCLTGMQWVNASMGRCTGYMGPVAGIASESQRACLSVLEVCCLKQVGLDMCEAGKQLALDQQLCTARDFDPGSEQLRECCHCCQMGVAARMQSASCEPPGLGAPCDAKFVECCSGRPSSNNTIAVFQSGSEPSRESENPSDQPADALRTNSSSHSFNESDNVDECSVFAGAVCSHLCVDLPHGFLCSCPTGYELTDDQRTCRFIDASEVLDCSINNRCEHRCASKNSGAECQCHEGYRLNHDGRTCADINECEAGTYRCSSNQVCFNTKGGYSCLTADCLLGSMRNPRTGQCESDNTCLTGFAFNSITLKCEDVNECALGTDDCGMNTRCENTNGGFMCRRIHHCGTGYTLDEASQDCVDTDECQLGTHNCANGFVCQNMQGSFRCVPRECPAGYRFNSGRGDCEPIVCRRGLRPNRAGICEDINECEENSHRCQQHQTCTNTVGGYRCRSLVNCPPGYEPTSNSGCQDINECESGTHRCGPEQECVNRQGSYFCQCPRGLRHDATGRCLDVNECAYGAAICPSTSKCVNTHGSYKCECNDGYISDESGGCLDIDECLVDNLCQHECRNVPGSFFCVCNRGYQLREDKRSCEDIDECTQYRGIGGRGGVCGGRCINTPGSYRCECPEGWRLKRDGRSCEDIDECADNTAYCMASQPDGICVNTRGSYKCPVVRCPEGFAKTTVTGKQHSVRCKRMDTDCPECRRGLLSRSYNFLTFPDNVIVPASLFSMAGATDTDKTYSWRLHLLSARPMLAGVLPAGMHDFKLEESLDQAVVSLVSRVDGPQDVELRLDMNISSFYSGFEGVAESRIFLYISDDGNGL